MIQEAPSSRFSISILDNQFQLQSTARSMKIRMLQLSKKKNFVFKKFHLSSTIAIINVLRVIFFKILAMYQNVLINAHTAKNITLKHCYFFFKLSRIYTFAWVTLVKLPHCWKSRVKTQLYISLPVLLELEFVFMKHYASNH